MEKTREISMEMICFTLLRSFFFLLLEYFKNRVVFFLYFTLLVGLFKRQGEGRHSLRGISQTHSLRVFNQIFHLSVLVNQD